MAKILKFKYLPVPRNYPKKGMSRWWFGSEGKRRVGTTPHTLPEDRVLRRLFRNVAPSTKSTIQFLNSGGLTYRVVVMSVGIRKEIREKFLGAIEKQMGWIR